MKIVAGDFNGDKKTDIASLGIPGSGIDFQIFSSTGSSFTAPARWAYLPTWTWGSMKLAGGTS